MKGSEARQYVKDRLSQRAIILQLVEEASELSAATSKLLRVMDGENPSPVSLEEARDHVLEECGDVMNCIELTITPEEYASVVDRRVRKFERWAKRIAEHKEMESNGQ